MRTTTTLLIATLTAAAALASPDSNRYLIPNTSDQWPHWSGPYGHHTAKDCADELVDDVSKARVAWVSEGKFPGPNDCHLDPNTMSSPIVAEDKVFHSYYEYTEELWDQNWLDRNSKKKKFVECGPDWKDKKDAPKFPTPTEPKEGSLRFVGYLSPILVDGYILCRAPYRVICWDLRAR